MKIAIGSDQGGIELKDFLVEELKNEKFDIEDLGIYEKKSIDYPDKAKELSKKVSQGEYNFGIIICGTGIGVSISANKVEGIRCALCTNEYMAKMARQHNNANVLALGGRVIGFELAKEIALTFLSTSFESGGRHERRVNKIMKI